MPQDSDQIFVSHAEDPWKGIPEFRYTHYYREVNHLLPLVANICYFTSQLGLISVYIPMIGNNY